MARRLGCGCIVVIILFAVLVNIGARMPRTETPVSPADRTAVPVSAPTQAITPTFGVATLDEAARAILATQQFFTNQMTQAAAGQPVATVGMAAMPVNVQAVERITIYAQGSVNVRECPNTECAIVGPFLGGQSLPTTAMVEGERVRGDNKVWWQVDYYGKTGYVYSEFVSEQPPTIAPTSRPTQPPISVAPVQVYQPVCNGADDLNCENFCGHLRDAQLQADTCNNEDRLDSGRDADRAACEETDC